MGPQHINLTLPTPNGADLTQDEETALLGQWVTVLAFGQSYLAQVEEVTSLPWDGARMDIRAKVGQPVEAEESLEPEFHAGTLPPPVCPVINAECPGNADGIQCKSPCVVPDGHA